MSAKYYYHVRTVPGGTWIRLYNFPVGGWLLQPDHISCLAGEAIPFLKADPVRTVFVWGLASPTGSEARNLALSLKRAQQVYKYLQRRGVPASQFEQKYGDLKGWGDRPARTEEAVAASGEGYFRAAELWLLKNITKKSFSSFASRDILAPRLGFE